MAPPVGGKVEKPFALSLNCTAHAGSLHDDDQVCLHCAKSGSLPYEQRRCAELVCGQCLKRSGIFTIVESRTHGIR